MREIGRSEDFKRISALPSRAPGTFDPALVRALSDVLKAPGGTMDLRAIQAQALYEIGTERGFLGSLRVGSGKTIVSLLASHVLELKRPILLLPASLREKTEHERRRLAKHWRVARNLRLVSYEELGQAKAAELLTYHRPDGIVCDEAHRLKNRKAGVTRRVARYMRENPETVFVAMSGTLIKASINDVAHLAQWAFGDGSPFPLHAGELEEWASCLDENTNPFNRTHPGRLQDWALPEDEDEDEFRTARRAFRRRLMSTPGVLSTGDDTVSCSLYVRPLEFRPSDVTDANFAKLRSTWETPDGWPLSQAVDVWRHAKELALGLHYVWDPRPPMAWLSARRAWAAFVRETLSRSRTLDTELQVANACERGDLPAGEYHAWRNIRDTFRPNSVPVWHDDTALGVCEAWLKKGPGIVWVEHSFFGDELERRTGVPYFREGGMNKKGEQLQVLADQVAEGLLKPFPIIASSIACATGFNLQPWHRNLITSCPTSAADLEQLLGRTHRDGQKADAIEVDILLSCIEHVDAWEKARARARMTDDTLGAPQKILLADSLFPTSEELVGGHYQGPRWTKQSGPKRDAPAD